MRIRSRFRSFALGLAVLGVATTFIGCGKHCEEVVIHEEWSLTDLETLIRDGGGGEAGAQPDADLVEAAADAATVIDAGPDADAGKLPDASASSEASMWRSRDCKSLCTELNHASARGHHDAHTLMCHWSGHGSGTSLEGVRRAERHLELDPNHLRALTLGAGTLVTLGEPERAREWCGRAVATAADSADPALTYNAACVYAQLGENEAALEKGVARGFRKARLDAERPRSRRPSRRATVRAAHREAPVSLTSRRSCGFVDLPNRRKERERLP
jgi:hypothetical protein